MGIKPKLPPNTPSRADARNWLSSSMDTLAGLSPITNNKIGLAQQSANTSKNQKTGGK